MLACLVFQILIDQVFRFGFKCGKNYNEKETWAVCGGEKRERDRGTGREAEMERNHFAAA